MATAGVSIASAVVEEEGTSAPVETAVDVIPQPIVDAADRQYAAAATAVARMPQQRVVAPLTVRTMPQRRAVAPLTAAADRLAANRMVAANTTSGWLAEWQRTEQEAAEHNSSAALLFPRSAAAQTSGVPPAPTSRNSESRGWRNLAITLIPPPPPTPPFAAPGCSCAPA